MRYTSAKNQVRRGAVWSPGPVANSLWLIDDETGEPVAVKVPKGDVTAAAELTRWETPAHEHDYDGRIRSCSDSFCLRGMDQSLRDHIARKGYRYAPKLFEKVWRAAVGDQCEQLELIAA